MTTPTLPRRRRRSRLHARPLAALALGAGLVLAGCGSDDTRVDAGPTASSPATSPAAARSTPTGSPATASAPGTISSTTSSETSTSAGETGETGETTPPLPYLQDGRVVVPGADDVDTGYRMVDIAHLAVLTDGRVVVALSPQGPGAADDACRGASACVVVLPGNDPDAAEPLRYDLGDAVLLRSSADRSLVGWVGADDRPEVLEAGEEEPVPLAALPRARGSFPQLVGLAGSSCRDGGCRAFASLNAGVNRVVTADRVGRLATPADVRLADVYAEAGQAALLAGAEESGGGEQIPCSVLLDPATGARQARSCDSGFLRFSPDGEHLTGAVYENDRSPRVLVLDTDLRQVGVIEPDGADVSQVAWDGSDHLVAALLDTSGARPRWSLARYDLADLDHPQVLAGPVTGREFPHAFVLPD